MGKCDKYDLKSTTPLMNTKEDVFDPTSPGISRPPSPSTILHYIFCFLPSSFSGGANRIFLFACCELTWHCRIETWKKQFKLQLNKYGADGLEQEQTKKPLLLMTSCSGNPNFSQTPQPNRQFNNQPLAEMQ